MAAAKNLITYQALAGSLDALSKDNTLKIVLICGESFLVRKALDTLVPVLLKGESKQFGLDVLDGKTTPVGEIAEQAGTFSFLGTREVIAVKDAPLFLIKASPGEISYGEKDLQVLVRLFEGGIPDNHVLVFTTGTPDRRKKIYKLILEHGLVVDCSVATGARKADIEEQQAVLRDISRQMLLKSGKQMPPDAFAALVDQTGFNPELFSNAIEKLLTYTGGRNQISVADIRAVVHKDKKDPIFSLTNAVMERDVSKALTLLSGLLSGGFHPLQILKTLENQVRKLLAIKCFTTGLNTGKAGGPALRGMQFNAFKQMILPAIIDWDANTLKADQENISLFRVDDDKNKKKSAKPPANDLLLAPNPKNAYPIFQNFLKSENFALEELTHALLALSELDYRIKSSGADAVTGLENFVMTLCRRPY
ncbi:DNA polymerase III subunit delta [Desulfobacter hydrogenophilus]|uniref:DNA polymerase III subunit delta n=1 Tax=Desulfobacter hydrogenophilus TaxID=2291 RepID=A0A328F6M3_9BACT|nr:DNA polymerase III subunit delta [Desulfobacter hydrogenophilus]NDY74204.1 DNA polymerase III subunit delta [Desulfobacter hydrogenophilus]QBH14464.1 DNA polymerase III subunit delta [Desulfobacter hydrogenophilus]RAM00214.1 DNA polymerase III subunit delta [Desulfobacter hydrogenophilus]